MKSFKNMAAQGDLLLQKIESLPEGLGPVDVEDGVYVVAHSETGHNHVIARAGVTMYRLPDEIYEAFLVVESPAVLEHKRDFDTHESLEIGPGTYRVRRQREHTPEGYRRAAD